MPNIWYIGLQTIGNMKADPKVRVKARCERCQTFFPVDLDKIIEAKGAEYSLINKATACTTPGCDGRIFFLASSGEATPLSPLRDK